MTEDGPRRGEPDGARDTPPPGAPSPYPAEECTGPTPYDPTILVFRSIPWITKPGVYPGLTNTDYQRDPVVGGSVTSSFLRKMTPPEGTPAHARHYLTAPREEKGYYDVGSGYHTMTLGRGDAMVEIEADDWKSPKARALRDAAYRARNIPLLSKHVRVVEAMHATTMAHPRCAEFFTPGRFTAELVIVWEDPDTGVMCRAMIDAVPDYLTRMVMVDLKTKAGNADPVSVSTSLAKYRYHQQFAFYLAGLRELVRLGLIAPVEAIDPWIVVCGTEPPHVPLCRPIAEDAINVGMVENRKALDLYATCRATGEWPGYDDPDGPLQVIDLPKWKYYQFNAALTDGVFDTEELW